METTFGTGGLSREVCSHQETRSWIFFSLVAGNHSLNVFYYNCCDLCNENVGSVEKNTLFLFSFFFFAFHNLEDPRSSKKHSKGYSYPNSDNRIACVSASLFELWTASLWHHGPKGFRSDFCLATINYTQVSEQCLESYLEDRMRHLT